MNAGGEKLVASGLATLAVGFMALWSVVPGWALHAPGLGVSSAVLVPFGHLAMRSEFSDAVVLLLAIGLILALGAYLGWAWIRGRLLRALVYSALVYGSAIVAALLAGVD